MFPAVDQLAQVLKGGLTKQLMAFMDVTQGEFMVYGAVDYHSAHTKGNIVSKRFVYMASSSSKYCYQVVIYIHAANPASRTVSVT